MATNKVHKPPIKPIFCMNFTTIFVYILGLFWASEAAQNRPKMAIFFLPACLPATRPGQFGPVLGRF